MKMAWLLLLAIFWKPIYYAAMYVYARYKQDTTNTYGELLANWFKALWSLVA